MAGTVIRRGDFIIVSLAGDLGKPRPALVVSSNNFELPSITVCPVTSDLKDDADTFRLTVQPTPENGLNKISQISIDKISAIYLKRVGKVVGHADDAVMDECSRMLAVYLGIV